MRKIAIIFLSISLTCLNICFGCLKEPFHRDGCFEYQQHMFWWRNKKNNFQSRTLILMPGPDASHKETSEVSVVPRDSFRKL